MEAFAHHTVNDDEGFVGGVQGGPLADADGASGTGRSRALRDLQAGDFAQQEVLRSVGLDAVELAGFHGDDRTGEVALAHLAVADDHDFVQVLVVRGEVDDLRQERCLADDGGVTDAAHFHKGVSAAHRDCECTVRCSGNAVGGSLFDDGGSGYRPLGVDHDPLHLISALGGCCHGHHAQQQGDHEFLQGSFHKCTV